MIFLPEATPERFLLGYLVLSAKKTPEFPFLRNSHRIPGLVENGSYSGILTSVASEQNAFFYPQRGRKYSMCSSANYPNTESIQPVMAGFAEIYDSSRPDLPFQNNLHGALAEKVVSNSLIFIEQEQPYGFGALLSKGVEVFMYGLYTTDFALLAWTNSPTLFEASLYEQYGNAFWTYRFLPRRDFTLLLFSKRLCSRWYRWSQQENFHSVASRFPALERALFRPELNSTRLPEDGLQ